MDADHGDVHQGVGEFYSERGAPQHGGYRGVLSRQPGGRRRHYSHRVFRASGQQAPPSLHVDGVTSGGTEHRCLHELGGAVRSPAFRLSRAGGIHAGDSINPAPRTGAARFVGRWQAPASRDGANRQFACPSGCRRTG